MIDALTGMRSLLRIAATALIMTTGTIVAAKVAQADQSPFDIRQKADEQEMLDKARREAAERRAPKRLEGTVGASDDSPTRKTVNIGEPSAAERVIEARKREDELQRLSDKLRRASQLRSARPAAPVDTPWKTEVTEADAPKPDYHPQERSALGHKLIAPRADSTDSRVAVLMVMKPGDRGIRRLEKTADPILCTLEGCYISNGSGTPAQFISLRRSFGFLNTFGPRAGACRQQTACVFRGVDITAANAIVQPVDMKVMVHDRRAMKPAVADDSCTVDAGRLSCARPIRGEDYTLWVVPETVAAKAGSAALARAVEDGLPETRRAALAR
jgi:hypothetical protein